MPDFDLLVLGDANPDLIVRGDVAPEFGQAEKLVDRADLVIGGSGAIAACGAARLGLRVAFSGVVGEDVFGRFMLDALAERDVDIQGLVVDPSRPTGLSVVLSKGEDRATLTSLGAIPHLREGHEAGASTSIDPNWDPAAEWDGGLLSLLSQTDCFLPNSVEARSITGVDDIDIAALTLAERGSIVAVKFGQGGGLALWGDDVVRSESIPADVVDTTGAGDSFDAGFLAGRLAGLPLSRCLQLAVACGSLSTRAAGGTAAQPTMDEAVAALESVA